MQGTIIGDFDLLGSIADGGGGSEVSVTPVLQDGTKICTISVDGVSYDIYAPTPVTPPIVGYTDQLTTENKLLIGGLEVGNEVTPVYAPNVSYTDSTTDGETIGTLTVGSHTYNVKQKPSQSAIDYSTQEQDTGLKWIDGRSIYQKTFTGTTNNTIYYIPNTTDIDEVVNIFGYMNDISFKYHLPYYDGGDYATLGNNSSGVRLYTSNYFNGKDFVVTIQYVKVVS